MAVGAWRKAQGGKRVAAGAQRKAHGGKTREDEQGAGSGGALPELLRVDR